MVQPWLTMVNHATMVNVSPRSKFSEISYLQVNNYYLIQHTCSVSDFERTFCMSLAWVGEAKLEQAADQKWMSRDHIGASLKWFLRTNDPQKRE